MQVIMGFYRTEKELLYRTLRKDVSKYMQFANRVSRTFDFELSYEEVALYMRVNSFLKRDYLYSLPTANRNLLTLVIRKLLASSSFALIMLCNGIICKSKSCAGNFFV